MKYFNLITNFKNMEKKQNFYWLDNFKTNIHKDEFFKEHPEKTLILVIINKKNKKR